MSMDLKIILASVSCVCLGLFAFIIWKIINRIKWYMAQSLVSCGINYEYTNELTMKDVILFFKDHDRLSILRNNKKIIACAVKQAQGQHVLVILSLFDTDNGDIVEHFGYKANKLDECLFSSFGDKDMIVLK